AAPFRLPSGKSTQPPNSELAKRTETSRAKTAARRGGSGSNQRPSAAASPAASARKYSPGRRSGRLQPLTGGSSLLADPQRLPDAEPGRPQLPEPARLHARDPRRQILLVARRARFHGGQVRP